MLNTQTVGHAFLGYSGRNKIEMGIKRLKEEEKIVLGYIVEDNIYSIDYFVKILVKKLGCDNSDVFPIPDLNDINGLGIVCGKWNFIYLITSPANTIEEFITRKIVMCSIQEMYSRLASLILVNKEEKNCFISQIRNFGIGKSDYCFSILKSEKNINATVKSILREKNGVVKPSPIITTWNAFCEIIDNNLNMYKTNTLNLRQPFFYAYTHECFVGDNTIYPTIKVFDTNNGEYIIILFVPGLIELNCINFGYSYDVYGKMSNPFKSINKESIPYDTDLSSDHSNNILSNWNMEGDFYFSFPTKDNLSLIDVKDDRGIRYITLRYPSPKD